MIGPALTALAGILRRDLARFVMQRGRLLAALVRPLVWLVVFAAGFRMAIGVSITPPYTTYIVYDVYIVPGLVGMIILFNGMQASLGLVWEREMGSLRLMLTAPFPRWWLLFAKTAAAATVSILQAYVFLGIAAAWGVVAPWQGYLYALPAMFLLALMVGALGLALSALVPQLENFAGVMNFVIFPMFFLSSALYPVWRMAEASPLLARLCAMNPFTHGVELIRFALYGAFNAPALGWLALATLAFGAAAIRLYDPARGTLRRRA